MDLQKKLDQILKQVEKPGRYIGGEVNSIKKTEEEATERMAFAFPDLYDPEGLRRTHPRHCADGQRRAAG